METKGLFSSLIPIEVRPSGTRRRRVAATGDHAHSRLFTGSAGPVGARLPHPARRLPKELAWAGSTEMAAASRYLAAQCLPAYHPRVAGPASEAGTPSSRGATHTSPRCSVCKTSGSCQGHHRAVSGGESADPPGPTPLRLCEGHCASPRDIGWDLCCGPMVPGVWRGIVPRVTSLATPDRNPRQEAAASLGLRPARRSSAKYERALFQKQMKGRCGENRADHVRHQPNT